VHWSRKIFRNEGIQFEEPAQSSIGSSELVDTITYSMGKIKQCRCAYD